MKVINVMNFVRFIDERMENSTELLYNTTKAQLDAVNEFGIENTFLLQYDAFTDERFASLFKDNATEKTELGVWFEIVKPMTDRCNLPYRSENGWVWDWHIIPGYSMAYTPNEREMLIDETMERFKEVFGYYPKSFAGWVIDTHTLNHLVKKYGISAVAICRDQVNTDAYTLVGGYFNQAYFPSKNNIFTPAQTQENTVNIPVFRLLGPCPVYNYDGKKYLSEELKKIHGCYTLEPVWYSGKTPEVVDWFFKTYYENEDLGFSYAQLGQENSFGYEDIITPFRMQLKKAVKLKDVSIEKMCVTGERFKEKYRGITPATAVCALDSWDSDEIQSVWYDCKNYTANLFRYGSEIFIRAFYLFDERIPEHYIEKTCTTFDAIYENLPIVDTVINAPDKKEDIGITLDRSAVPFNAEKAVTGELCVKWNDKKVLFDEDGITVITNVPTVFHTDTATQEIKVSDTTLDFSYKGHRYSLEITGANVTVLQCGLISIAPVNGKIRFIPKRA